MPGTKLGEARKIVLRCVAERDPWRVETAINGSAWRNLDNDAKGGPPEPLHIYLTPFHE
jgi:hypothetical protein